MEESCKSCIHYKRAKELVNKAWKNFHVCDLFKNEEDPFYIVVTDDDMCEEYSRKEKQCR